MLKMGSFAFVAAAFTLGLFWVMQQMISGSGQQEQTESNRTMVDFVRLQQESRTELKERHKSEPPKIQKPQIPEQSLNSSSSASLPALHTGLSAGALDMSISHNSLLGDATVSGSGMGFGDSDVMPLVRMNAQYPQRAIRQKIEGYVTARLFINGEGSVDNVEILDAQPSGIFEREAIRAMYKYKFKPKMENGRAQPQTATQTIEFKLAEGEN
ncbi:MAG: hypothetical protein RL217_583 [Pseudomonadota bacterium]|jgi:protein TonB